MRGEPDKFVIDQAVERSNGTKCGYDLGQRRGFGWGLG
jgi:hypothetical protein